MINGNISKDLITIKISEDIFLSGCIINETKDL